MASTFWGDGFMDDDDDVGIGEQNDEKKPWEVGRDGLILLIDATRPMFQQHISDDDDEDENLSPFEKCMKCAKNVLMNKIISSEKDLIGVVLFGTSKRQNSSDFEHVFTLQELDMPDAPRVLQTEHLEAMASDDFDTEYGHSDDFALSDALWECSNMFANTTFKLSHKRILLFTATDHPHAGNRDLEKRALKKAKDLSDIGVGVELLHMGRGFDVGRFYCDVVNCDDGSTLVGNPAERFDELMSRVRMKENKKRVTARMLFNIGE